MASREKWGKLEVRRQIDSGFFERYALSNTKVSPLATQLPAKINEHLKDIYSLEFLELGDDFSESDLQKAIDASNILFGNATNEHCKTWVKKILEL